MKPIVLDTCIFMSGLVGHGASVALVDGFFANRLSFACSLETLAEYAEVTERPKFRIERAERAAIFTKLRVSAVLVQPCTVPNLDWPDPKDLLFVAAAMATELKIIVTLNYKDFGPAESLGVKILSPNQAIAFLQR